MPRPNTAGLVRRARLFNKLDVTKKSKLYLVSAAAGFGKTTFLADWIQHEKLPAAWISLDESDNDPLHFWRYVFFALKIFYPEFEKSLLVMLDSPQVPPLEIIATNLINQLIEFANDGKLPEDIYLVLDDFHVIQNEKITESLNFLLDHIPPFLHLVIATRSDPYLNLARRRARGEVSELRVGDLRFTVFESDQFFNEILHLELNVKDVATLAKRTEGWAAGLQLAGLSIQEREDRHQFVVDFAGNDRYIADYLLEEVLQTRSSEVQEFLRKTAILDRLCASLCNFLTGRSDSRELLDQIETSNLFLIALDSRREWYRYHHLFAELLRQRLLEIEGANKILDLYKQASLWHETHHFMAEAIEYALSGKDYERAAFLMESFGETFFANNELSILVGWVDKLPRHYLSLFPKLGIMTCWALVATVQLNKVDEISNLVEKRLGASLEDLSSEEKLNTLAPQVLTALSTLAIIQATIAINNQNLARCKYLCGIALKVLEKPGAPAFFNDPKSLITIIHFNQGLVYELSGDLIHAADALNQAFNNAIETMNFHIITLSLSHMAQNQIIEGKLHLAMETFQRSVELSKGVENTISPLSGLAKVGLGNLFYEWNDLVNARQFLEEGVALAKQWNNWETLVPGYGGWARLLWAEGNYQGTYAKLDELKSFLKENKADNFSIALALLYSHFWLMEGKLAKVEQWLTDSAIHADLEINHIQEPVLAVLARFLAMKHDAKAENLITKLIEYTRSRGQGGRLLELYITKALWCDLTQNKAAALETLREALCLAEPEGYMRIFVDEGSPMARLIYQAAQEGFMPHYTAKLLAAFPPTDLEPMEKQRLISLQSPLVEPLSEREIEVLHLISEGLSNAEIASRLTLSITTIKSHTRNINLKLGVNSRTQAVARARTLGILA